MWKLGPSCVSGTAERASGSRAGDGSRGVLATTHPTPHPTTPDTSDATWGAPAHASAHRQRAIDPPMTRIMGVPRRRAGIPPWRWATANPVTMVGSAKSAAMWGPISSPGIFVTSWMVKYDAPSDPNDTAHAWPTSTMAAARAAPNPMKTIRGATTATGTPKPAIPCMNPEKAHPTTRACARGSSTSRVIVRPMTSMPPSSSTTL